MSIKKKELAEHAIYAFYITYIKLDVHFERIIPYFQTQDLR